MVLLNLKGQMKMNDERYKELIMLDLTHEIAITSFYLEELITAFSRFKEEQQLKGPLTTDEILPPSDRP